MINIQKKLKELEANLGIDQQNLQRAMNLVDQTKANIIAKQGAIQCLRDLEAEEKKVEETKKTSKTKNQK